MGLVKKLDITIKIHHVNCNFYVFFSPSTILCRSAAPANLYGLIFSYCWRDCCSCFIEYIGPSFMYEWWWFLWELIICCNYHYDVLKSSSGCSQTHLIQNPDCCTAHIMMLHRFIRYWTLHIFPWFFYID